MLALQLMARIESPMLRADEENLGREKTLAEAELLIIPCIDRWTSMAQPLIPHALRRAARASLSSSAMSRAPAHALQGALLA